ncbi:hypothetical protein DWQ65_03325 [Treponema phagedenis]|nr:hypothetical protein DWQ65_03325 [Treponema phagedenis]
MEFIHQRKDEHERRCIKRAIEELASESCCKWTQPVSLVRRERKIRKGFFTYFAFICISKLYCFIQYNLKIM